MLRLGRGRPTVVAARAPPDRPAGRLSLGSGRLRSRRLAPQPATEHDIDTAHQAAHARLLAYALSLPEAWEDHPWGESAAKVRKKAFVFFGAPDTLHCTMKLPESGAFILHEPWAEPTGYGLGKSGWVSCSFTEMLVEDVPVELLEDLIEESYRAIAPKTLAKLLDVADASGGDAPDA